MSAENSAFERIYEAAKAAEDAELEAIAFSDFTHEELLEEGATMNTLVRDQAESLVKYMMRLSKRSVGRLVGSEVLKLQRIKYPKLATGANIIIKTPLLMSSEIQDDRGLRLVQGWQFTARSVEGERSSTFLPKSMLPLYVEIERHLQAYTGKIDEVTEKLHIPIRELVIKTDDFAYPVETRKPLRQDPEDPELYKMYALLKLARQELGDKKAK
jgi:hypothetical protein